MKRGWEAAVLRALRGKDFRLTVLAGEPVTERYHRLRVDGGGLIQTCGLHPTMWIRLWFDDAGSPHQRAYTLVDPDPATGHFSLEFSLHDGVAARWALAATPGDTIEATVQGSRFALPDPPPRQAFVVGDPASLPAVNGLLPLLAGTPTHVWIEYAHDSDLDLPVRAASRHTLTWVPRREDGRHLVGVVRSALSPDTTRPRNDYFWVAAEAGTTRTLERHLRRVLHVDRQRVSALGYWRAA